MFRDVRTVWVGEGEDAGAWSRAIGAFSGDLVKRDRKREVWRGKLLGTPVAVKVQRFDGWWRGLRCASGIGPFDEERERAGGRLLSAAGIESAPILACVRARAGGARVSVSVSEWLDGRTLLEAMAEETDARSRQAHGFEAGRVLGVLLKSGLLNRDHKPSNQIVVSPSGSGVRFALIDVGGVRLSTERESSAARMLSAMVLEPAGVGCPPGARDAAACLRGVCSALGHDGSAGRALRRELVRRVRDTVARHGDPTPRINPLSP